MDEELGSGHVGRVAVASQAISIEGGHGVLELGGVVEDFGSVDGGGLAVTEVSSARSIGLGLDV